MIEVQEESKPIRCSKIQGNRMQCLRLADIKIPEDGDNSHALCKVCWLLSGSPKEYTEEIVRD